MIFPFSLMSSSVATYTVHEQPDPPVDRIDRAEKLTFISDGFSWNAALFTPLWLLGQRLWVPLGIYVAGLALLAGLLVLFGAHPAMTTMLVAAYQLLWGYEADEFQRQALGAKGWTEIGTVSGRNRSECERRFFDAWLPSQPILTPRQNPQSPQPMLAPETPPPAVVGATAPRPLWRRIVAAGTRKSTRPA